MQRIETQHTVYRPDPDTIDVLDHGFIKYINHYMQGDDLDIANIAWSSTGKHATEPSKATERITNYCGREGHTSPFRHTHATFLIRAPIFILRQMDKHRIGVEANEQSGRYVQFDTIYHKPTEWRKGSPSIKQGSLDECLEGHKAAEFHERYQQAMDMVFDLYNDMIEADICSEQARMGLPLSLYSTRTVTFSLQAAAHFVQLRDKPNAQREIQVYAQTLDTFMNVLYPVAYSSLVKIDS